MAVATPADSVAAHAAEPTPAAARRAEDATRPTRPARWPLEWFVVVMVVVMVIVVSVRIAAVLDANRVDSMTGASRESSTSSQCPSSRGRARSGDQVRRDRHLVDDEYRPWRLRRTAASPLDGDDHPVDHQLAAPHPVGLGAAEGGREAHRSESALRADRLGASEIELVLGEEEPGQGSLAVGASWITRPSWGVVDRRGRELRSRAGTVRTGQGEVGACHAGQEPVTRPISHIFGKSFSTTTSPAGRPPERRIRQPPTSGRPQRSMRIFPTFAFASMWRCASAISSTPNRESITGRSTPVSNRGSTSAMNR